MCKIREYIVLYLMLDRLGRKEDLLSLGVQQSSIESEDIRRKAIADAITEIFTLFKRCNKYIDETTPWVLAKDPARIDELASVMNHLANAIFIAAMLYKPVLVTASDKAFDQLGVPENLRSYDNIYSFGILGNVDVQKGDPLFPRLDPSIEVPFIKELMGEK